MNELEYYIKTNFKVGEQYIKTIADCYELTCLNRNDFFLKEGQQVHHTGFVQKGILRNYKNVDGKEVTQWISTQGTFVTDLSGFVFDTPSRWNIQALTDCQVFTLTKEKHKYLADVIPHWQEIDKFFIVKCFTMMEMRIFSHLHMTSEQRYDNLMELQPDLFNEVPLQYLASMLGMTPETLSRIRRKSIS